MFFMIFKLFGFFHAQISKFWNENIAFIYLNLLSTLGWNEEKANLNQILNRNDLWEIVWLFFHTKLQLNTWKNYLTLGRTFQNLEKILKLSVPSTPIVCSFCVESINSLTWVTVVFPSPKLSSVTIVLYLEWTGWKTSRCVARW